MSPHQSLIKLAPTTNAQWSNCIDQVSKGKPLATALFNCKQINRYEREILDVANQAGRLPEGLLHIADQVEQRKQRISRLKVRLFYPFAVLIVGIAVTTLLQAIQNDGSLMGAISNGLILLIAAGLLTKLFLSLFTMDGCQVLSRFNSLSSQSWYQRLFQHIVFSCLACQIKSGIDFKSGFLRVSRLLDQKALRQQLVKVAQHCGQGNSVSHSLAAADLPISHDFQAILHTAEQSGEWSSAIDRALAIQQQELNQNIEQVFDWAPRVYYALIVVVAISVIM